ncbi:hypothetical protein Taro_015999 [Colocasia esculenta]|uniref:Aminotransferase-like plant mobile domain-containing protein n=1 Tax=Colocasia esculenta TaxID=4460 RepID=A0A843UMN8_COLES|nr:hypothetical protein [Colocasia esculenta]
MIIHDNCDIITLLEDLSSVGNYAWGAALLAHLFDSLGTSSRETSVAGFFPLLQVWAYYHLPSLGRGVARRRGAVWWTPYVGEDDATQPWVERGRPYFGRDIWLHCFNTVVPLHHRLVARTLGLHQAVVEFPTRQRAWERPSRSFRGIQQVTDWTVRVREQLDNWEQRGKEVVSEATSDEDYFRAYARRYGAQVYKGTRRPLDPEGWISSLEGVLHSTIQQRDDLQAVVDQLRAELDRAQQMVGGASSSREDPGRSVLEGQLASAVTRAEDALVRLQEREQELRTALARTTTLEAGDGGATPTPRGSGGGAVAPGGRGGGTLAAGGGGGGALAPGGRGGGATARRGRGPPHPARGGEASQRHAVIRDEVQRPNSTRYGYTNPHRMRASRYRGEYPNKKNSSLFYLEELGGSLWLFKGFDGTIAGRQWKILASMVLTPSSCLCNSTDRTPNTK